MPRKKPVKPTDPLSKCPCGKSIRKTAWIACSHCNQWWHAGCVSLTKEICDIFKKKKLEYKCPSCTIDQLKESDLSILSSSEDEPEKSSQPGIVGRCTEQSVYVKGNLEIVKDSLPHTDSNDHVNIANKENVLIIDGIADPLSFQTSREIKKEIRDKKNIETKIAYALPRGGIAIEANTEEEAEKLKEPWPDSAFGDSGHSITVHNNSPLPRCVVKNVATHLSATSVSQTIQSQTGAQVKVRRLRYSDSNKPLKIVSVSCNSFEDLKLLYKTEIIFGKSRGEVKPYKSKRFTPVRCYSCQQFGHIALLCKAEKKCVKCAENHSGACTTNIKCANCGENHPASSSRCPAFLEIQKRLALR